MKVTSIFQKSLVTAAVLGLTLGMNNIAFASEKAEGAKSSAAVSCKDEAKNAGITDKKEIKEFVSKCKKDRKAAKKDSK